MATSLRSRPAPSPWRATSEGRLARVVRLRRGQVVVPSLAAGAALAFSLPPFGWWPLAFVGAAILFLRLAGLRLRTRALAGWVAGLGCFIPGLAWSAAFNWYGAAILMVVEALSMGVASALVPPRRGRLGAFVGAFTLLEALRLTWPFGGLPLGGVFLGQAGGPLLATARLGGPLLLTAEVWLVGGLAAVLGTLAWRWWRGEWASGRQVAAAAVPLALVVGLWVGAGAAPDGGPPVGHLAVAAVQGGGLRGTRAPQVNPATVLRAQLRATGPLVTQATSAGHRHPDLVIWPEDVVSLDRPLRSSPQAAVLAALARRLRATLVAGVTVDVSATAFRNEAVAWAPDGRIVARYEKVHRVPFGEYVPYRSFFSHLANLSAVPRDAIPGHGSGLMVTPAAKLGVLLSYEVFFADRGRAPVQAGARVLVVPTNTSSYATSQVPCQEVAADRVQAVETGRDLIQAAPTGFSTLVTSSGAVVRRSTLGTASVLQGTVALRHGRTLFDDTGNLVVLVGAGMALAGGWALALDSRRKRW